MQDLREKEVGDKALNLRPVDPEFVHYSMPVLVETLPVKFLVVISSSRKKRFAEDIRFSGKDKTAPRERYIERITAKKQQKLKQG